LGSGFSVLLLFLIVAVPAIVLGGVRTWIMVPTYGLVVLLLGVQAVRLARRPVGGWRPDVIDGFVGAFLLYALGRYATSPIEYLSRLEMMNIVSYATVFWVARYGLSRAAHGVAFYAGYGVLALGLALFSFWYHFHPEIHLWKESLNVFYAPRLVGTFGCPDHFAAFLYMAIAVSLAIALFLRGRWMTRIFAFYGVGLMATAMAFTLSRGGWIALFFVGVVITVFCVRNASLRWYWPVGALLLLTLLGVATIFFVPAWAGRLQEISYIMDGRLTSYVRISLALDTFRIIGDHFWLGTGPATFVNVHPHYQGAKWPFLAVYPHDDYLNLFSDYGCVGFALGLGFVVSVSVKLTRTIDFRAPWAYRALLCGAVGAWAGIVVHSFFDFSLHIPACAFALFTVAGLGLRKRESREDEVAAPSRPFSLGLAAALIAVALVVGAQAVRIGGAVYPYREVSTRLSTITFAEAVPFLQKSAAADPHFPEAPARLADFYRAEAAKLPTIPQRQALGRQAITWYLRALQANPLDDALYMRLGMTYDELGRYTEAYLAYQKAIEGQPHNGYFRNALGMHFWSRGMIPQAVFAFQAAVACPFGREDAAASLKALQNAGVR
jgi:tetratricopeptide (TPR) repeat protein